jgi:hypothetical protein
MKQNSRCPILFHLRMPGGKWQAFKVIPTLSAKARSDFFHRRLRLAVSSATSAVINSLVARGMLAEPISFHQRCILAQAQSAVSSSMPTLIRPSLQARPYAPLRIRLPLVFVGKVGHVDLFRLALGLPFHAGILVFNAEADFHPRRLLKRGGVQVQQIAISTDSQGYAGISPSGDLSFGPGNRLKGKLRHAPLACASG